MSAGNRVYWGLRTFCLVTGASRGIGQELAFQFAQKFKSGSVMVLVARSVKGLQETKKRIESNCQGIRVAVAPADLYKPNNEEYYNIISDALREFKVTPRSFEHAILVHNAGVALIKTHVLTTDNLDLLHNDVNINVYSAISLNVQFLKIFTKENVSKRSVVHMSSYAAVHAVPGLGFYCMAKAARNMYFRALAVEDPTLDIISYSPGPVDTSLSQEALAHVDKEKMDKLRKSGKFLTPERTVKYLVNLLTEGEYESGEFKDIYTPEQHHDFVSML